MTIVAVNGRRVKCTLLHINLLDETGNPMQQYKRDFLDLALRSGALTFGEFTLKSGRISPYFFNAGQFNTGAALLALGRCYAAALLDSGLEFDMLFGPAYKGIPLVAATAQALAAQGRDTAFAFDRKEVKDHGEGGNIIGAPLTGRVVIVDDVITAGTAVRGATETIHSAGAQSVAVSISLDRQERGQGKTSAVLEVEKAEGLKVISIACMTDLLHFLADRPTHEMHLNRVREYRNHWGA